MPEPHALLDPLSFRRNGKTNMLTEIFVSQMESLIGDPFKSYRNGQFLDYLTRSRRSP